MPVVTTAEYVVMRQVYGTGGRGTGRIRTSIVSGYGRTPVALRADHGRRQQARPRGETRAHQGVPDPTQARRAGRSGGDRRGVRAERSRRGGRHAVLPRVPRPRPHGLPALRRAL